MDTVHSLEGFAILRELFNGSKLGKKLEEESGPFTLLAPTDEGFTRYLSQQQIDELIRDKKKSDRFLQMHILPQMLCCSGVNPSPLFLSYQTFRTLGGSAVSGHHDLRGKVKLGSSTVTTCDLMATNGAVHVLNRVLQPNQPLFSSDRFGVGVSPNPFASHPIMGLFFRK
jgi:uncharacterized surface protein with fasciclin (FAS1) repeats